MINNGTFYIVTSDFLSISYFNSYKKDGISIEIVQNIEDVSQLLTQVTSYDELMILVDISNNEQTIFSTLSSFVQSFPAKQIICFTETVELEHIRKAKELSISSVITRNDTQKLFELIKYQ
jgi:DNA-binding NarL/FixJ family response regulator